MSLEGSPVGAARVGAVAERGTHAVQAYAATTQDNSRQVEVRGNRKPILE
jgi:hypothetical protein